MSEAPAAGGARWLSGGLLGAWLVLGAAQLGWIPLLRTAWAFNLWSYHAPWVAFACAALSLALCAHPVREGLLRAAAGARARAGRLPRRSAAVAGFVLVVAVLWLLRERHIAGDSVLLVLAAREGWQFVFQEPGASFLIHQAVALADAFQLGPVNGVRALSCLSGGAAVFALLAATRHLVPRHLAPAMLLLLLSGGLGRVFAGHVEVYAPLLLAAALYFWAALAHLHGTAPWWAPGLALGGCVWMHASAACLAPSLLLLPWLAPRPVAAPAAPLRALASALLAGLPSLAFFALLLAIGYGEDVHRAVASMLEVLGRSPDPDATRWWVRGWGGAPSIGTDVVFLSGSHLKYLTNAGYLLLPVLAPLLLALAATAPRRLAASPEARFLWVAALPLGVYACLLRPFWGPFDWDLFSLPVLAFALPTLHLLARSLPAPTLAQLCAALIGFQLLFVGLPFVATGFARVRPAGPFRPDQWSIELRKPLAPPPPALAPWL